MAAGIFGRNFKSLREDYGYTQQSVAQSLEVTQTTVSLWENRDRSPRQEEIIQRITNLFDCSRQDLFGYTDGYYYKKNGLSTIEAKPVSSYAPVIGDVSAGEPHEAIEYSGEVHWVDPDVLAMYPSGYFLHVSGDSMNKVLPDGCLAFVAPGEVSSGSVAVVKVNGDEAVIKRVKIYDGVIILEPESTNESHRRRVIDASDPDAPAVRLIGRVVWFASNL